MLVVVLSFLLPLILPVIINSIVFLCELNFYFICQIHPIALETIQMKLFFNKPILRECTNISIMDTKSNFIIHFILCIPIPKKLKQKENILLNILKLTCFSFLLFAVTAELSQSRLPMTSLDTNVDYNMDTLSRTKRSPLIESTANTVPVYCDRFIVPITENSTFFSPMDPRSATNTYPPNADCRFVLTGKNEIS